MDDLEAGETISFILDAGRSARDVPRSLAADGHELLGRGPEGDGAERVLVRKGERGVRPIVQPIAPLPGTAARTDRYIRQEVLPGMGAASTRRFAAAAVRLEGAGRTLAWAAHYLAGAGVGTIFTPPGATALADRLRSLNSSVRVDSATRPCDRAILVRSGETPAAALFHGAFAAAEVLEAL